MSTSTTLIPGVPLVLRVTSLADFCQALPAPASVRLLLVVSQGAHTARHQLSLQGVEATGAVVWLAELQHVAWLYGQPFGATAASVATGMRTLFDLVRTWLTAQGYTVQVGDYALPDFLHPLAASFECATWVRDPQTDTWQVVVAPLTTAN